MGIKSETRNNRNILECKLHCPFKYSTQSFEIIETYWNVNCFCFSCNIFCIFEIIETYWNVNEVYLPYKNEYIIRNNRNILECKFGIARKLSCLRSEIIETYWNVNYKDNQTNEKIL